MKKVLHICNLGMNGKAVFVSNLLNATDFDKYEVTILNFWGQVAEPIAKRLEGLPVRIINPIGRGFFNFVRDLNTLLKAEKFDVVHSHMWDLSGIFLTIAKWYGVPVRVAHSHNSQKVQGRYNLVKEFVRDKLVWNILKYAIEKNANRYLSCSDLAANWLYTNRLVQMGGVNIVNNGIDLKVFSPNDNKESSDTILFVGRFLHQKNPSFAYEVFKVYKQKHANAKFIMVGGGDGEAQKQMEKQAKNDGLQDAITFVGSTSEIHEYYRNADVLLMPSFYEGLPLTLVEAQACGTRCLVSDTVTKECDCGLIQYKSLHDGAESWAQTLEDIRKVDLKINKERLNQFSSLNTAESVYKIYNR